MSLLTMPPDLSAPADLPHGTPLVWPDNFDQEDFAKLKQAVDNSYKHLAPHRDRRLAAIRQDAGSSYGENDKAAGQATTVVNMLAQMVRTYVQQLASGNPQTMVLTQKLALRTAARYYELSLNHVLTQIDVQSALETSVKEAMFSMGAVKVGVELPEHSQRAYPFDASAIPFAEAVFFDNFVFDTSVPSWDLIGFCGDKYRELREIVEDDQRNNPKALESLDAATANAFTQPGQESAENLSGGEQVYEMEAKDFVWLWDVWVPRKRLVITYAKENGEEPLRIKKWDGPPDGMYFPLWFETVLNNIMPKAPVNDVLPLADIENELVTKLSEQASRQKTIAFANINSTKDAKTIISASDGDVVNVSHPEGVREASFGGVKQETLTFAQWINARCSKEAGNLDTMSGMSTGADTLGQEELLKQSASARIQWYQQKVVKWTTKIVSAIGWYIWNDPLVRISVTDKIPGTDVELEVKWPIQQDEYGQELDMRQGELNDFNFQVQPYSLAPQTPQAALSFIRSIVREEIIPMAQMLAAQGVTLDFQELYRIYARYANRPELLDILQFSGPLQPDDSPVNMGGQKPAQTTRQYDRVVRSGGGENDSMAKIVGGMPGTDSGTGMGA